MFTIKNINADQAIPLRHQILRAHQPIATCYYPGDDDNTTAHFGAFADDALIGIISIYKEPCTLLNKKNNAWRLRAMGVLDTYRRQGVGKMLMEAAMAYATKNAAIVVWCNARVVALDFYRALEFKTHGDKFEISGIGDHYVMIKSTTLLS